MDTATVTPVYETTDKWTIGFVTLANGQARQATCSRGVVAVYNRRGNKIPANERLTSTYVVLGPQVNGYELAAAHADALAENAQRDQWAAHLPTCEVCA